MNRSKIRELAFELLYSLEIQKVEKESIEEQIKIFLEKVLQFGTKYGIIFIKGYYTLWYYDI